MKHLLVIMVITLPFLSGKRTPGVDLYLEDGQGRNLIAFKQTGEQGKASFGYLDAGTYRLLVEFPQQTGKWIEEKPRHATLAKATFNPKNKTYYYQGMEGYFAIKFSGLRKIEPENFQPVFREIRLDEGIQINVLQFQTRRKGGQVTVLVKTLTAAQFKRKAEKAGNDLSMLSIPGIK